MRFLIFSYDFYPFNKATAKMVHKILLEFSSGNILIDVISKGNSKKTIIINQSISNYQCIDYDNCNFSLRKLFYKIFRKIYSRFCIWGLFDTKRFLKIGKKLTSHNKYDAIISFSGVFSAHNAAYLLSKQTKIPLFLFYADPFSSNFVLRNKNQHSLFKLEEKWIHQSQLVFLPKNYHTEYSNLFVNYLDKFVECELPGFFNDEELHTINHTPVQKELIVYAGDFFQRFREPLNFIKLAQLFPNFKFIVLGCLNAKSCQKITIPKNICIVGRLTKDKYLKTIGAAQALFLEDNVFPNQIPYKAFEYISTGKPIIYSTKNKESSASKLLENYDRLVVFDNEQFDKDDFLKKISINCTNFTLSDYYDKYKTCFVSDIILKSIEKQLDI